MKNFYSTSIVFLFPSIKNILLAHMIIFLLCAFFLASHFNSLLNQKPGFVKKIHLRDYIVKYLDKGEYRVFSEHLNIILFLSKQRLKTERKHHK